MMSTEEEIRILQTKVDKIKDKQKNVIRRQSSKGVIAIADEVRHFPLYALSDDYSTRSVTFTLPGCVMELDMYGHPSIRSIIWQFAPCVSYHLSNPIPRDGSYWLFNFRKLVSERMFSFVATSMRVQIEAAMYRSDTSMNDISATLKLAKSNSKTVYVVVEFRTSDKETKLLTAVLLLGFFSMTTRSLLELSEDRIGILPTPSPDNVLDFSPSEFGSPRPDAFIHHITVTWGNLEFHGHLGFHWYVQYAMDAVALAIESPGSERSWTISDVHLAAGVKQVKVKYMKEVLHADQLKLCVWQDDVRADTAQCCMEKNDQVIALLAITFYTETSQS